ncbi:MAG: hypothetical protein AABY03_01360, partial [Nanoarchaeota archaeon]
MVLLSDIKGELEKYSININSFAKFSGGTSANTYILKSNNNKYILKLYNLSDKKRVKYLINCLKKVNQKGIIAIDPINSKVLEVGKEVGYFYEFFPGESYDKCRIQNKLFSFGKIVGKFSNQTKNIF